jgi:hypothetical protein
MSAAGEKIGFGEALQILQAQLSYRRSGAWLEGVEV